MGEDSGAWGGVEEPGRSERWGGGGVRVPSWRLACSTRGSSRSRQYLRRASRSSRSSGASSPSSPSGSRQSKAAAAGGGGGWGGVVSAPALRPTHTCAPAAARGPGRGGSWESRPPVPTHPAMGGPYPPSGLRSGPGAAAGQRVAAPWGPGGAGGDTAGGPGTLNCTSPRDTPNYSPRGPQDP